MLTKNCTVLEVHLGCSPLAWMLAVTEAVTVYWDSQQPQIKLMGCLRSHLQGCSLSVTHICLSGSRPTIRWDGA